MKTNGRALKNWPLVHSVLKNSPMIKTGKLQDVLRGHICKTDLFNFLNVYETQNLIIRPTRGLIVLVDNKDKTDRKNSVGFFGWLERRAERKAREKAEKLLSMEAEGLALMEEAEMIEDEWTPEKAAKLRQKYRKLLKDS